MDWRAAAAGVLAAAMAAPVHADPPRSGYDYMTPQVRAMQDDDALNPAMLWVAEGESLWNAVAGSSGKSCASCHGDAAVSMRGVAARYPAYDDTTAKPLDLRQRIQQCRVRHQQATPLPEGSEDLIALETYVARQSRGLPIAPPADARLAPYRERGARWFQQRMGQLDLSCAQCHDDRAGQRLGGSTIPQAHPTGYPIYRLEWQGMGSLARRIHGCMTGVRAEPFPADSPELVELELYLAQRAAGLKVDAPAVRP